MPKRAYLESTAELSEDGLYRYALRRRMSMGDRAVLFCGLNPSTADATQDDPTIRREVDFAQRWGFDWLLMGNLHAWRSTDPKALPSLPDPVGPDNREALASMADHAEIIVAAWGQNWLSREAKQIARWLLALPQTRCLGLNQDGSPKHPLYLAKTTELQVLAAPGR